MDKEQEILQANLSDFLYHEVFNIFNPKEFLSKTKAGKYVFQGRQLTEEETLSLKQQADAFKNSFLWKILQGELKYHEHIRQQKSQTASDLIAVRAISYVNKVIIDKIAEIH